MSVLLLMLHCLEYGSFTVSKSGSMSPLTLFFIQVFLALPGICIYILMLESAVGFYIKAYWDFDWDCIKSINQV